RCLSPPLGCSPPAGGSSSLRRATNPPTTRTSSLTRTSNPPAPQRGAPPDTTTRPRQGGCFASQEDTHGEDNPRRRRTTALRSVDRRPVGPDPHRDPGRC